jgi:hypothetical protein
MRGLKVLVKFGVLYMEQHLKVCRKIIKTVVKTQFKSLKNRRMMHDGRYDEIDESKSHGCRRVRPSRVQIAQEIG